MVGAEEGEFNAIRPMLEAMGTSIHHCGPVGTGIRTKLVNNYLAITLCQINAEALALTRRFGLDLERTLEVLHGTTATNGQLRINYATKVLKGDITPGFQIDLAHKDLSLVTQAANANRPGARLGRSGFFRPAGCSLRERRYRAGTLFRPRRCRLIGWPMAGAGCLARLVEARCPNRDHGSGWL